MTTSNLPVVALRGVGKVYEPTPSWMRFLVRSAITQPIVALDDIHVELAAGDMCAVVGPNGAGKTTMFRILTGLTTPSSGDARVLGIDAYQDSDRVRRIIGWMPAEDRSLFMRLTCYENLYFHGRLQEMSRADLLIRIPEILEQVGLASKVHSSIFALSSGMRARVQLARALLHRPRLLILDEPTATVDPLGAHQLLSLITQVVTEHGLAALISSHRLEEIEALHANVVLLDQGRVRYQGDLDALRREWGNIHLEMTFLRADQAETAADLLSPGLAIGQLGDRTLRVSLSHGVVVGDVLQKLGALSSALTNIHETSLPLRDLLADVYASAAETVRSVR